MTGPNAHRLVSLVLSALTFAVGCALTVQSLTSGASALSGRLLLGVLIIAAGVARGYIAVRRGRDA